MEESIESTELSAEQAEVVRLVREGRNVFFTGFAGTGKTFTLERVVDALRDKFGANGFKESVAVTATTGIAASQIGGQTLNAALGIGAVNVYDDFKSMRTVPQTRARIRAWKVLVVDECSMLSAEMLEELERQFREVRNDSRPAGGLQLVLAGDFNQLPPVSRRITPSTPPEAFVNFGFAFMAPAWNRCGFRCVLLRRVFRQKDEEMVNALAALREGPASKAARKALRLIVRTCARPLTLGCPAASSAKSNADDIRIVPTQIFSRNKDVDDTNERELLKLVRGNKGGNTTTTSQDGVGQNAIVKLASVDEVAVDRPTAPDAARMRAKLENSEFFRDCLVRSEVGLCVGAQVMLLKNMDTAEGYVNGSRGVVTGFVRTPASASHLHVDVVGERVPSTAVVTSTALATWRGPFLPVVRFSDGEEMAVPPTKYTSYMHGVGECVRWQVPLKLAWAITVHKSQGLSLDAVCVSLRSMFAVGQAYVALSRARSLGGLQVLDWDVDYFECLRTDADVARFYKDVIGGDIEHGDNDAEQHQHQHHPAWKEYARQRETAKEAKKKREEKAAKEEEERQKAEMTALKSVKGEFLFR